MIIFVFFILRLSFSLSKPICLTVFSPCGVSSPSPCLCVWQYPCLCDWLGMAVFESMFVCIYVCVWFSSVWHYLFFLASLSKFVCFCVSDFLWQFLSLYICVYPLCVVCLSLHFSVSYCMCAYLSDVVWSRFFWLFDFSLCVFVSLSPCLCVWMCMAVFECVFLLWVFVLLSLRVLLSLCVSFVWLSVAVCMRIFYLFFLSPWLCGWLCVVECVCLCCVSVPVCLTECVCLCIWIYLDIYLCSSVCSRFYLISPLCAFVSLWHLVSDCVCFFVVGFVWFWVCVCASVSFFAWLCVHVFVCVCVLISFPLSLFLFISPIPCFWLCMFPAYLLMSACGSVCVCVFPLCILSNFILLSVVVFPSVFLFRYFFQIVWRIPCRFAKGKNPTSYWPETIWKPKINFYFPLPRFSYWPHRENPRKT